MNSTEKPAVIYGHCPRCGPRRNVDVRGFHKEHIEDDDNPVWWATEYRILQCRGCETVFFQADEIFSEEERHRINQSTGDSESYFPHKITHWPAPSKRNSPDWLMDLITIDSELYSLLTDIYTALNNELYILSAIGVRTGFDMVSNLLGIDSAKNFTEKLDELMSLGKIGLSEKNSLEILTDAGSAAAHRGWKPEARELDTMMSVFEAFLYRNFFLDAAINNLRSRVPQRQKRHKSGQREERDGCD
jgi:Domain of unknown function (DUF4145)